MDSESDLIEHEILERFNFCGCGAPEEFIRLINDVMQWIDKKLNKPYSGKFHGSEWDALTDDYEKAWDDLISSNRRGVEYALFYLLDSKEITTHGGAVPGWIEDKEFMNKVEKYVEGLKDE